MDHVILTESAKDAVREWAQIKRNKFSDLAQAVKVSQRTISTWINRDGQPKKVKITNFWRLIKRINRLDLWPEDQEVIGLPVLGSVLLMREDGVRVSILNQKMFEARLLLESSDNVPVQDRLDVLENEFLYLLTELSKTNRAIRTEKEGGELPSLF